MMSMGRSPLSFTSISIQGLVSGELVFQIIIGPIYIKQSLSILSFANWP